MATCPACGRPLVWSTGEPYRPDAVCGFCWAAGRRPHSPSLDPAALSAADRAALALALPADLRAVLDAAELEDVPREVLDDLIRAVTGGPGAVPGGLLYLQCHGYLFPEEDDAVLQSDGH